MEDVKTAQLDPQYIKILADFHVTDLLTLPIFQIGDWKMEENEQEKSKVKEQIPLSIILCDIDFFKLYNDSYGHPAGDSCLQQIAQVIVSAGKRPADLIARYGGEEFAIILPNTDPAGALIVAQEIRAKVEMLKFPHMKSPVSQYVTISVGVASIQFSGTTWERYSPKSPYTLIQEADRALYHAKAKGRNRICQSFYDPQSSPIACS